MADHLQTPINVSGHLEDRRGIFHIMLSWKDENGKRNRKSISTGLILKGNKKRAEEMLRKAKEDQETKLMEGPRTNDLLFADFMEEWLEVIRSDIKIVTFGSYQINVKNVIAPYFRKKGILLQELTSEDINEFYAEELKRIKGSSVCKSHGIINRVLKYAVDKEYIPYSIMNKVKRPKKERYVGKFLKQQEVIELFEAVKGHKLELGVILGAFYGLRRSEIVGLRWESIDFEANTLTIEHTVTGVRIDGKYIIVANDSTKTKSSFRTLPLVPSIREKLLEKKAEQNENRKLCGKSYNEKEGQYIYTDALGNRIRPDYLTEIFPKFLVENGFRRMRFHDLRHSCASLLLANGVPLKQIQEWLGHSDFAVTANVYAHLEFNSKLASAEAMTWIKNTSLAQKNVVGNSGTLNTESNIV